MRFLFLIVHLSVFSCKTDNRTSQNDSFETCFSPTTKDYSLFRNRAQGCSCSIALDSICVKVVDEDRDTINIGLICHSGKWVQIEDGPCSRVFK